MEAYARERVTGISPAQALVNAGYAKSIAEARPKFLEKNAAVKARIVYLAGDDQELLKAKRARLEVFLWDALAVDRASFYEMIDTPIRAKNGDIAIDPATGKPSWQQDPTAVCSNATFRPRATNRLTFTFSIGTDF